MLNEKIKEEKGGDSEYSILKNTINGNVYPLLLDDLRDKIQNRKETIDMFDLGGCGCFSVDIEDQSTVGKFKVKDLVVRRD